MDFKFSVLMSLYKNEKPGYFHECMDSIFNQTLLPNEIVLVEDGPLTEELRIEVDIFKKKSEIPFKNIKLEKNRGLGLALEAGIKECTYGLVARMDTDDVCVYNRFEKQIKAFKENPELDIVGSHIIEFDGEITNIVSSRKVPLTDEGIRKYQRKRSAFNHMTVMYKKDTVLKAGNYKDAPLMEDDVLWCQMLKIGALGQNLDTSLVYVRTGSAMIQRRGGWRYFRKYCAGRKQILDIGYITYVDYIVTCMIQLIVSLMPMRIRKVFFLRILRQ